MESVKLEIDVPKSILDYVDYRNINNQNRVRELMAYQLVLEDKVSFGKAAEMLGLDKITFITDLGKMGIPYLNDSIEEVLEDTDRVTELVFGDHL